MSVNPDELDQPQTDQGVPVGGADAEQDRLNASRDDDDVDDDTFLAEGSEEEKTDQGVPVGQADVREDRLNQNEPDEGSI